MYVVVSPRGLCVDCLMRGDSREIVVVLPDAILPLGMSPCLWEVYGGTEGWVNLHQVCDPKVYVSALLSDLHRGDWYSLAEWRFMRAIEEV